MIKKTFTALLMMLLSQIGFSQIKYAISIPERPKEVFSGHLNLGGTNPSGVNIDFNSFYMSIDGKPFIPIMGEVHFSRLQEKYWEEQILKIKAGGINVIPTYVFWSMHEAEEGTFDWSGNLNLRKFVELCQKHNMYTIVRLGPFCHGEIRNGGIPDWVYGKPFEIRSNDEEYLFYVRRLYHNIGKQLDGLYYKDGGSVIGVQLENELQASASPWSFSYPGQELEMTVANYDTEVTKIGVSVQDKQTLFEELGNEHLATLKKIAIEEGIIVPLYTVTGWGNAAVLEGETIPVTAAYAYPFWAEPSMSELYLFKDIQKIPDYSPVRYDGTQYPSFCAEMGAGIQITYARRPRVSAESAEAIMLRSLGSGANGIGYYMYHGGLTPQREGGTFYSDEPMGVPKISYDFQAPIGEYGKVKKSYFNLRIIHLFTENFASQLAPMGVVLPTTNDKITPKDRQTLRYSVRSNGKSGFVFMHNFQDHDARDVQEIGGLDIHLVDEQIKYPAFSLNRDVSVILPFNLIMKEALLKYATAQPLAIANIDDKLHYFFYAHKGIVPQYVFDKKSVSKILIENTELRNQIHIEPTIGLSGSFSVIDKSGNEIIVTTLSREQAMNFNQLQNSICITGATLLKNEEMIQLQSRSNKFNMSILSSSNPNFNNKRVKSVKEGLFTSYEVELPIVNVKFNTKEISRQRYTLDMNKSEFTDNLSDLILDIDYVGDTGVAFIEGRMINDHLYYGNHWQIGLKQYADRLSESGMYFYFRPIKENASYLIDFEEEKIPHFNGKTICNVKGINVIPEYKLEFSL